jgi:hypothetical protein
MVLPLIVNKTRQSPERRRIPAAPLSAFTSPLPVSGFRKNLQFEVDLRACRTGKFAPLADGGGSKLDLFHLTSIA